MHAQATEYFTEFVYNVCCTVVCIMASHYVQQEIIVTNNRQVIQAYYCTLRYVLQGITHNLFIQIFMLN